MCKQTLDYGLNSCQSCRENKEIVPLHSESSISYVLVEGSVNTNIFNFIRKEYPKILFDCFMKKEQLKSDFFFLSIHWSIVALNILQCDDTPGDTWLLVSRQFTPKWCDQGLSRVLCDFNSSHVSLWHSNGFRRDRWQLNNPVDGSILTSELNLRIHDGDIFGFKPVKLG